MATCPPRRHVPAPGSSLLVIGSTALRRRSGRGQAATWPILAHSIRMKRTRTPDALDVRVAVPELGGPNSAARSEDRRRHVAAQFREADQVGWQGRDDVSDVEAGGAQSLSTVSHQIIVIAGFRAGVCAANLPSALRCGIRLQSRLGDCAPRGHMGPGRSPHGAGRFG